MMPSLIVESATPLVKSGPVSFALSSLIRYLRGRCPRCGPCRLLENGCVGVAYAASGLSPSNAVVRPHRSWWTDRRRVYFGLSDASDRSRPALDAGSVAEGGPAASLTAHLAAAKDPL